MGSVGGHSRYNKDKWIKKTAQHFSGYFDAGREPRVTKLSRPFLLRDVTCLRRGKLVSRVLREQNGNQDVELKLGLEESPHQG